MGREAEPPAGGRVRRARRPRRSSALTERLARACARRPKTTIAAWLAIAAIAAIMTSQFVGGLVAADDFLNRPDSKKVDTLVAQRLPGASRDTEVIVVRSRALTVDDPAYRAAVTALTLRIIRLEPAHVASVASYYMAPSPEREAMVSKDRHTTIMPVELASPTLGAQPDVAKLSPLVRAADGHDGFQVVMTGTASWEYEAQQLAGTDLKTGELVGLPFAMVILVVVFGAIIAAVVPLVLAVVAIFVAIALTSLVGQTFTLSVFAINIITMMGLAVGIDYALFVVSRFREERAAGLDTVEAIAGAAATASRAVLFSGLTVVLALLGMLVVPFTVFTSLGVGATLVVLAAVAAALTLLPATLALLGGRIDAWRVPLPKLRRGGGGAANRAADAATAAPAGRHTVTRALGSAFWHRAARTVMRHRVITLTVGAGILLALAAPGLSMTRGETGVSGVPKRLAVRQGYEILRDEFSAGLTSPILVAVDGKLGDPAVKAAMTRFLQLVATEGRFTVTSVRKSPSGDLAVIDLAIDDEATGAGAAAAVDVLRKHLVPAAFAGVPARALVGGGPAAFADMISMIDHYTPIVLGLVLALSCLLLLLAFRSLVIAVQAVVMNLLSVGAAYGLLTLVFQKGIGASLLGFQHVGAVEAWVPLLLFCVLFGLSMDYQVFLLSRIREQYDRSGHTEDAVAFGISSTAGIITGAALIMVAVFAGLAAGELVIFQQIGFGLAVAIALDATLVRTIVVPSSMAVLGRWNWYLPRWLGWLPRATVEEEASPAPARPTPVES